MTSFNHERVIAVTLMAYGYSPQDVVEICGYSETTVRVWKHRYVDVFDGKEAMKEHIKQFEKLYTTLSKVILELMPFSNRAYQGL